MGPQTMAVDLWSLGLIALLLVTSKQGASDDLNRMSQHDLDKCLFMTFKKYRPRPSLNAQFFIEGCLRVSPDDRISTTEAECHDWLCTPEKHREFFRCLEERMLADWSPQKHLKPLPWELQSLRDSLEQSTYCYQDEEQANRDNNVGEPIKSGSGGDFNKSSAYFPNPELDGDETALVSIPASFNPTPKWENATNPTKVRGADEKTLYTRENMRLTHSRNLTISNRKTQSQHNKKRRATKIPDSLFLPPTGLERHLCPASTGLKREAILDELKKTNSMFIKGGVGAKDNASAGRPLRLPAKPNTKRQRNKHGENAAFKN